MQLFHERAFPRSAPLAKSDEEECFTPSGRRTGIFLSTETSGRGDVVAVDLVDDAVAEYEITEPGDAARTFVVPFAVIDAWRARA